MLVRLHLYEYLSKPIEITSGLFQNSQTHICVYPYTNYCTLPVQGQSVLQHSSKTHKHTHTHTHTHICVCTHKLLSTTCAKTVCPSAPVQRSFPTKHYFSTQQLNSPPPDRHTQSTQALQHRISPQLQRHPHAQALLLPSVPAPAAVHIPGGRPLS